MGRNRALLIGASDYDAPGIRPLHFIPGDMDALSEALRLRGYDVVIARPRKAVVSANFVNLEVIRFLTRARSGDTLLICLSGHGHHINARDYFVPEDAHPELQPFHTGLVALDWSCELQTSPAERIAFLVDACRDGFAPGFHGDTMSADSMGWSGGEISHVLHQKVAWVYACSQGQKARYVRADEHVRDGVDCGTRPEESFSLFSRAVRDVLLCHPEALDLPTLEEQVRDRVVELHRAYGKTSAVQTVRARGDKHGFLLAGPLADTQERPPPPAGRAPAPSPAPLVADQDPLRQLAVAQYRLLHYNDDGPLLALAATGPATYVVQLAQLVHKEARQRVWDACARRRPGPALFDLLGKLHGQGFVHIELGLFTAALRHRPADQLFEGVAPGEIDSTLIRLAKARDSSAVVAAVEALHAGGGIEAAVRLLHGAVWRRRPDQLPSLLGALRKSGLMPTAERVLAHYGRHCPADALGPALTALSEPGGRLADRQRLLAGAAHRPAGEVLECVAVLRAAGYDAFTGPLLARAATADAATAARLLHVLGSEPGTEADRDAVLNSAAAGLSVARLVDTVGLLHEVEPAAGMHNHALLLLSRVLARRGFAELICLVRRLAARWLDSDVQGVLGGWLTCRSMAELPELIEVLTVGGHGGEAECVLFEAARFRSAETVVDVFRVLRAAGAETPAARLVALLLDPRPRDDLPAVLDKLYGAEGGVEIRAALASAALALPVAELPDLLAAPSGEDASWRLHLREVVAGRRPLGELLELFEVPLAEGLRAKLAETAGSQRPVEELPDLVRALRERGIGDTRRALWKGVGHRPYAQLAVIIPKLEPDADELLISVSGWSSLMDVAFLVEELVKTGAGEQALRLAELAVTGRGVDDVPVLTAWWRSRGLGAVTDHTLVRAGHRWLVPQIVEAVRVLGAAASGEDVSLDAERLLLGAVTTKGARGVRQLVRALGARETAAEARAALRIAGESCGVEALARLVGKLTSGGMDEEVSQVLEAAAGSRPASEAVEFLRVLLSFGETIRAEEFLASVVERRSGEELGALLHLLSSGSFEDHDLTWAFQSLGARMPDSALVETVRSLNAAGQEAKIPLVLRAAFARRSPADLPGLIKALGMTEQPPGPIGGPTPAWQACQAALSEQPLAVLLDHEAALKRAGLVAGAAAVLAGAVRRPAGELARFVQEELRHQRGASHEQLLVAVARAPGFADVLGELRVMESKEGFDRALDRLARRLPASAMAVNAVRPSDIQRWAMEACPEPELIEILVRTAVQLPFGLDRGLVVLFVLCRPAEDVIHLTEVLRQRGMTYEGGKVLATAGSCCEDDEVVQLIEAAVSMRPPADTGPLIRGAVEHRRILPARLLTELNLRGLSAHVDTALAHYLSEPGRRECMPFTAVGLADAGLSAEAERVIRTYISLCSAEYLIDDLALAAPDAKKLIIDAAARHLPITALQDILMRLRPGGGAADPETFVSLALVALQNRPSAAEQAAVREIVDPYLPRKQPRRTVRRRRLQGPPVQPEA
ncbi:hypothetical protein AQI88_28395 [Streptomyces cellostaticus]|uniref:Caspase family p20 domain-containing protein n=1 Tax=Streptomyces cellostaticus TaxID=67285 RepID=A0A101NH33_9ACTN|nr:caspase family protein [Streptomyces cellostaticus]KUM93045.1 hypothetical protein AQI88_28395 [Streptomyces cellostaticus]GHI06068.1 hypothetical protein Scel_43890 [Streptomyces cellostaticus]